MNRFRQLSVAVVIAVVFEGIQAFWNISYGIPRTLSQVVIYSGISDLQLYIGAIVSCCIDVLLPVFLFELYYGTIIYSAFCNVSIFYFSRQCNRTLWFLKKAWELFQITVIYFSVRLLIRSLSFKAAGLLTLDTSGFMLAVYYVLIWSVWTFAMTLSVNLLALRLTSLGGFTGIIGGQLFFISLLCLFGTEGVFNIRDTSAGIRNKILFALNPMSQICICYQKSSVESIEKVLRSDCLYGYGILDINYSLGYCIIAAAVVIMAGCVIVNRYEFLSGNAETGGN